MRGKDSFRFKSAKAGEGVSVHVLPTRKFKTTTLCIFIGRELDERASDAALLGEVLKRGCAKYADMRAMAVELEEMYGASFRCGVSRIGGKQALVMRLTLAGESFLPGRVRLLERGFDFLEEMLLRPLVVGGAFKDEVVKVEKANLRARIESLVNDKMEYAQRRLVEEMCRGERFRYYEYGEAVRVAKITARGLFDFYGEMLGTRPVAVFAVGDVAEEKVVERARRMFSGRSAGDYSFAGPEAEPRGGRVRRVVERQEMEQAKLCVGLRTHVTARDPKYAAAVMYNGVLGAFPHSKLFRVVREKEGLAYDVHSYIENSKGLVIVGTGLESKNLKKALGIIEGQLEEMRRGRVTREEMSKTRKGIITHLRSSVDSPAQLIQLQYSQMVNGVGLTLAEWVRRIGAVTVADVKALAEKTAVDTIYVLEPREKARKKR
jgi:predicted Zn-dependent peptidase